ncbi:hypothetical protein EVAR_76017_1 [Eumeta japonica]|uniref:Uncharacterized protein n=1 Tax=Eumeta variegata TaxID=151549 RepID=A0A4C1UA35_EUMVA|nr:hypothetical protein EVAR_76017_1 [Eumeta japonica]
MKHRRKQEGITGLSREEAVDAFKMHVLEIPQSEWKKYYKSWFQVFSVFLLISDAILLSFPFILEVRFNKMSKLEHARRTNAHLTKCKKRGPICWSSKDVKSYVTSLVIGSHGRRLFPRGPDQTV